ncbi:hypothetical protein AB0C27_19565 [Nonomuraea sp. NPDC048882]|uniref:hypothetical protein n=1 Tax=Nonomuraea sp. NPDC048882 TaxID=3154347 RepID=UPI0033D88754
MTEEMPRLLSDDDGEIEDATTNATRPDLQNDLTETESGVASALKALGFEFTLASLDSISVQGPRIGRMIRRELRFPRSVVSILERQVSWEVREHPIYLGYISPKRGVAELLVTNNFGRPDWIGSRISRLTADSNSSCPHRAPEDMVPAMMCRYDITVREIAESPRVHLTAPDGRTCIEISNISPLGAIYHPRVGSQLDRFYGSIKFDLQGSLSSEELIQQIEDLLQSLLYELDVRNSLVLNVERREVPSSRASRMRSSDPIPAARFPEVSVRTEVASLFNFASSALGNLPLAFLSYYQSLEYYVPMAARRSAIRQMRKELSDPLFDKSRDEALMRLLTVTEAAVRPDEAAHFNTLITECVRRDRVISFLQQEGMRDHFSKKGPIKGVEALNSDNPNRDILDQIASRVYKIRNRIVHAKDDPRFANERVLLPRSDEAESLAPDVQLIRLLATEVILDAQNR